MLSKLKGPVIFIILLIFFIWFIWVEGIDSSHRNRFFTESPPIVVEKVSNFSQNDGTFYYPAESSSFTEINTFKNIVAWRDYEYQNPILIVGNAIFVAGFILEDGENPSRTTVDLFSIDISTGELNWQALGGSNHIVANQTHIFIEATREAFVPSGIISYDIHSGHFVWETQFDWKYAVGVDYFVVQQSNLIAHTYNKGYAAHYILNSDTGAILEFIDDNRAVIPLDREATYKDLVFEKVGYEGVALISAILKSDGTIIWEYDQPVASNIVASDSVAYFLTTKGQLIALEVNTGMMLASMEFSPHFPDDYNLANNSIIVAADGNTVVVYFEDKRQLSLFSFNQVIQ